MTIQKIHSELIKANRNKPWMTARRIAKACGLPVNYTETLLHDHITETRANGSVPKIRYSNLPSKKTLEVLWGSCRSPKGDGRSTKPLQRTDPIDTSLDIEDLADANIFFSHSHKDYKQVFKIATHLVEHRLAPWLAETHIPEGCLINEEIIGAMKEAQVFLLFLSLNPLSSRWSGKEYGRASANGKKIPIFIVADNKCATTRGIAKCLSAKQDLWESHQSNELKGAALDFFQCLA